MYWIVILYVVIKIEGGVIGYVQCVGIIVYVQDCGDWFEQFFVIGWYVGCYMVENGCWVIGM